MSVALVSIEVSQAGGLELLSQVVHAVLPFNPTPSFSSVYEARMAREAFGSKMFSLSHHEEEAVLTMAIKMSTDLGVEEFSKKIQKLRLVFENRTQGWVRITLLAFDQVVEFDPQFPLPHPDLHRLARYLIPALDVWPSFYHAIVGQTISEIAHRGDYSVNFFCQAKALLDFLRSKQYDSTNSENVVK